MPSALNHLCCSFLNSAPSADDFVGGPETALMAQDDCRGPSPRFAGATDEAFLDTSLALRFCCLSLSPKGPPAIPSCSQPSRVHANRLMLWVGHRERARVLPAWAASRMDGPTDGPPGCFSTWRERVSLCKCSNRQSPWDRNRCRKVRLFLTFCPEDY